MRTCAARNLRAGAHYSRHSIGVRAANRSPAQTFCDSSFLLHSFYTCLSGRRRSTHAKRRSLFVTPKPGSPRPREIAPRERTTSVPSRPESRTSGAQLSIRRRLGRLRRSSTRIAWDSSGHGGLTTPDSRGPASAGSRSFRSTSQPSCDARAPHSALQPIRLAAHDGRAASDCQTRLERFASRSSGGCLVPPRASAQDHSTERQETQ
jgi:hypothetical protein